MTTSSECPEREARALQVRAIEAGKVLDRPALSAVRDFHAEVRDAVGPMGTLVLDRRAS